MTTVYLDNAATTPLAEPVREALAPFLGEEFGNPSSRHALGVRASEALTHARAQVARALGAKASEVTFTSGGTEANNLAVLGAARARGKQGARILIGATEHPSVRAAGEALEAEGFDIQVIPLDEAGNLDLQIAEALLTPETVVVAQMLVNNEVGTIYPVAKLARLAHEHAPQVHVHTDAVQGLGKLALDLDELGVDSCSVSAHKVHGLKGTGALVTRPGTRLQPLIFGGGQQGGVRPGTENVVGAVAFGAAAQLADDRCEQTFEHAADLRTQLAQGLEALSGVSLLEPGTERMPSICSLLVPGAPAEVWQHHLEARGVFVSVGSACQSNDSSVSPALLALGLDADRARRVLRLSFSALTTGEELQAALDALGSLAPELEGLS
ncbi:MAG: cysteine desulfurase family protein [Planctomycetota bacterium]|jgi:cysteine desulfurase|nr:cysteine desulfurase family protein [Planctomycetota bacterium]MDP6938506.1 cysteine desulfurase family protein [Planctomycetota bacterium]